MKILFWVIKLFVIVNISCKPTRYSEVASFPNEEQYAPDLRFAEAKILKGNMDCFPAASPGESKCWAKLAVNGVTTTFYFMSPSTPELNNIGFSWQCKGYQGMGPLPEFCTINFYGPIANSTCPKNESSLERTNQGIIECESIPNQAATCSCRKDTPTSIGE